MDELLKALAKAIETGTTFAMPALVGYYVVRIVEAIIPAVWLVCIFTIAGRTIRACVALYYEKAQALEEAKTNTWRARRESPNLKEQK